EHITEFAQVVQCCGGGGGDVTPTVIPVILAQGEHPAGGWNELPDASGMGRGVGHGVVAAFHEGQQRQLQRHVALVQLFYYIVQVTLGALGSDFEIARLGGEKQTLLIDAGIVLYRGVEQEAIADACPQGAWFIDLLRYPPARLGGLGAVCRACRRGRGQGFDSGGLARWAGGGLTADKYD